MGGLEAVEGLAVQRGRLKGGRISIAEHEEVMGEAGWFRPALR